MGHLVLASPSLEKAIELVARAEPHFGPRVPRLDPTDGDRLRFGVVGGDSIPSAGAQVEIELTAVLLYDVARLFLDDRFGSPAMQFVFRAPADLSPYQRVFAGELEFGCDGTFCVFPRAALRRRSGADAGLLKHFFELAREHYGNAHAREDWTSRVRSALRSHPAPRLVEPSELSAQLGLSTRAMSRRLGREGVTLSQLIDDVLYERARAALRRPGVTAGQVAEELGYAELSSFFRAFRRWSRGLTPKEYRERNEL